jgi:hypothetical protein
MGRFVGCGAAELQLELGSSANSVGRLRHFALLVFVLPRHFTKGPSDTLQLGPSNLIPVHLNVLSIVLYLDHSEC